MERLILVNNGHFLISAFPNGSTEIFVKYRVSWKNRAQDADLISLYYQVAKKNFNRGIYNASYYRKGYQVEDDPMVVYRNCQCEKLSELLAGKYIAGHDEVILGKHGLYAITREDFCIEKGRYELYAFNGNVLVRDGFYSIQSAVEEIWYFQLCELPRTRTGNKRIIYEVWDSVEQKTVERITVYA